MVRTQIQLTEEQFAGLKALAAAKGVSMAELIRQGVDLVLKLNPTVEAGRGERVRRAIEAAGRFRSGLSDLSTNHDKYLAEALSK